MLMVYTKYLHIDCIYYQRSCSFFEDSQSSDSDMKFGAINVEHVRFFMLKINVLMGAKNATLEMAEINVVTWRKM
jgi:hypothetical protein